MTERIIELTSMQIKLLEVASMSYVDDCHDRAQRAGADVTHNYKYQAALYLHFLLKQARSLTLRIEDPHEVPALVPAHRVYIHTSYKEEVTVPSK